MVCSFSYGGGDDIFVSVDTPIRIDRFMVPRNRMKDPTTIKNYFFYYMLHISDEISDAIFQQFHEWEMQGDCPVCCSAHSMEVVDQVCRCFFCGHIE